MTEDKVNIYISINNACRHLSSLYKKNLDEACIKHLQRKFGFNIITKPATTKGKLIDALVYVKEHANEIFPDSYNEVIKNCDRYITYINKAFD